MDGLVFAFGFLTVIPMPFLSPRPGGMGRAAAWFPLVGLVVGAALAATAFGAQVLWHDQWMAASLVLIVGLVLTGGLHLDGLMDTGDALFSHRDRERMLEIMRDSRAGALGVASGVLLLLAKFAALSALIGAGSRFAWIAIALALAMGRASMVLATVCFPSARASGLGASFAAEVRGRHAVIGLGVALVVAVALAQWQGLVLFGLAVAIALLGGLYWRRRLGGLTGDIYGAINECTELAALLAAGAMMR